MIEMTDIRSLFSKASENEDACEELMKITDGYTMDYKPVVYAYHAAAEMTMANHVLWPGSKYGYFSDGKAKLEKVAAKYPDEIEIRYVRFAVQSGSPSFLGYKSDMESDENFIRKNIDHSNWPTQFKNSVLALLDKY